MPVWKCSFARPSTRTPRSFGRAIPAWRAHWNPRCADVIPLKPDAAGVRSDSGLQAQSLAGLLVYAAAPDIERRDRPRGIEPGVKGKCRAVFGLPQSIQGLRG